MTFDLSRTKQPWFGLVVATTLAASTATTPAQSALALASLTVPARSLPGGCRLTPVAQPSTTAVLSGTTPVTVTRARPESSFPANPWLGSNRKLLVEVRSLIDRPWPSSIPDALPTEIGRTSPSEPNWIEHVVEGYYARYDLRDSSDVLNSFVEVSAIRLDDAGLATQTPPVTNLLRPMPGDRTVIGDVVVNVAGPKSDCLRSVDAYVRSLK